MPASPRSRSGYLPSLDGWRALAVLSVMAVHDSAYTWRGTSLRWLQNYGSLGVVLFFAISGVLITGRILEEEALTGRFHLRLFYIRRFFRIQPAALLYLSVVAILALAGAFEISWFHWSAALLMFENFAYRDNILNWQFGFFTGHFWTLAVEEHFYILISLALLLVRRHRLRVFAIALAVIKLSQYVLQHHTPDPLLRRTYWQVHVLLWPTLFAIALRKPGIRDFVERWFHPGLVVPLTFGLAALAHTRSPNLPLNVFEYAFTLWIVSTMLHPRSWLTRLLESAPIRFVGRISYSLYLWHILFFSSAFLKTVHAPWLIAISARPWKYVCAFSAAVASYYLIEKPCIRLGHRLAPPATAGHKDLETEPTLAPMQSDALTVS